MLRRLWTREELILALSVYFQLPFGRLNHTTPEVKELMGDNNDIAQMLALLHDLQGIEFVRLLSLFNRTGRIISQLF